MVGIWVLPEPLRSGARGVSGKTLSTIVARGNAGRIMYGSPVL